MRLREEASGAVLDWDDEDGVNWVSKGESGLRECAASMAAEADREEVGLLIGSAAEPSEGEAFCEVEDSEKLAWRRGRLSRFDQSIADNSAGDEEEKEVGWQSSWWME